MNLGLIGYLGATIAYGFLAILLFFSWRRSRQGRLLMLAMLTSAIWAGIAAGLAVGDADEIAAYQALEILRYITWYVFLLMLFNPAAVQNRTYRNFLIWSLPLSVGFGCLLLAYVVTTGPALSLTGLIGHVILAIIGLAILEQLFRNTSLRHRWTTKYLLLGAGGIIACDFFLYVDAILFHGIDRHFWEMRGFVNMFAVPLLAVAASRSKDWSLNVFVSRDIVLNTTVVSIGWLYMLVIAGAGYYLREYGGTWGQVIQVVFVSLAVILLAVVLFSAQLRARMRVFLGKHFYENKYDYRQEWLSLTGELNDKGQGENRYEAVIHVLARIVDARAGMLWLRDEHRCYRNAAVFNISRIESVLTAETALIRFLEEKGYLINLLELESHAREYQGLVLPEWLASVNRPWLVIPLFRLESLLGFVVLSNPLIVRTINWEDRDLLKTAANQVASYVAVLMASEALAEARQFEVFNRLSAYMVHDLKNIAAELELVVRNAEKHMDNPGFVKEAFETIDNASGEIKRLLDQFRSRRLHNEKAAIVDLRSLVERVIETKQDKSPKPHLVSSCESCLVAAEKGRLTNVLAHLIDNAQQATPDEGFVTVTLASEGKQHALEITDNGHGMDADFIHNRLFRPFDTTKGNAGMGIGMYESREFIRHLGGEVYVQSAPGDGTTISLHFPASTSTLPSL